MAQVKHARGTQADFDSLVIANGLIEGQLYHITDTPSIAIATSTNTFNVFGGGGGTLITGFQVQDDGVTGQLTTGTATDLNGIWGTPTETNADFTWNGTTGELTFNSGGKAVVTAVAAGWNDLNNRNQTHLQLMHDDGGGYLKLIESSTYSTRDNTQDEGAVYFPSFQKTVVSGDSIKLRVFDVGVAVTIGAPNVANQTYLSVMLYK